MKKLDQGILLIVFLLLGIGLVQVYSSSFIFSTETRGDGLFFFKRQLLFLAIGIATLFITSLLPFRWLEKSALPLWLMAVAGLIATFIPGIGLRGGGAARWVHFPGGFNIEPSELIKVAFPLLLASFFNHDKTQWSGGKWGFWLFIIFAPLILLLRQPDFGSFAICTIILLILLFCFGLRWSYILASTATVIPAIYFLIMRVPYRRARVMAFLDPWQDPSQKGFQVIQSMLSFHSGGFTGRGLGQGQSKLFFLPEAHTDFTLAVLGEELGFLGFLFVISLLGYLVFRGFQIAFQSEDRFTKGAALGLTSVLGLGVVINSGVALGLLPTKGLTLPFLSYGGTSLVMTCFAVGLLLNIDKRNQSLVGVRSSRHWKSKIKIK